MSYEERKKASLGQGYTLYCPTCMKEHEVYSAAGHKENQMNLHCVVCANFVARLIREDPADSWELDTSVYKSLGGVS